MEEPHPARDGPERSPALPTACATCGTAPDDPEAALLTWSRGTEDGREAWTCDACSREHLRSIEGKLDTAWW
jgi:hypothetical protein